jgi:hypothetical protein
MSDITQICGSCGKKFLIIAQEKEFLQKRGMPLPTLCPTDRQARRLETRGERTLYKTTCQQCGKDVVTSYDPAKAVSKILCKKCYLEYFEKNEIVEK